MRDQADQPPPAGHQHAGPRPGQQRQQFLGAARVVQQHEHPPVRADRPVQRGALLGGGGHLLRGHAQRAQEPAEHLPGVQRLPVGVVAVQVGVQLAVREVLAHPVRPVHGQRGLAHSRGPGDHHHRAGAVRLGQQRVQLGQFTVPAQEGGGVAGQLRRGRGGAQVGAGAARGHRAARRRRFRRTAGQDDLVQPAQFRSWLHAQFGDQHGARGAVGGQRLGRAAGLVQGAHQQPVQPFPQRVLGEQPGQLAHQAGAPAQGEAQFGVLLQHGQPSLDQPAPLHLGEQPGHPAQRVGPPHAQRLGQGGGRLGQLTGVAQPGGPGRALLEHLQVEGAGVDAQQVAVRGGGQQPAGGAAGPARLQCPAQPGDVGLDQVHRAGRRGLGPHRVDDPGPADRGVPGQQQHGQHGALLGRAQLHRGGGVLVGPAHRPEHAENLEPHSFPDVVRHRPALRPSRVPEPVAAPRHGNPHKPRCGQRRDWCSPLPVFL